MTVFFFIYRLCNNDVSEVVAQAASCLKPKDFKRTLNIVRSVLNHGDLSPSKKRTLSSPAKSPSKSLTSSQRSSPSKTPTRKRNISFASPTAADEDSGPKSELCPLYIRSMCDESCIWLANDDDEYSASPNHVAAEAIIHGPIKRKTAGRTALPESPTKKRKLASPSKESTRTSPRLPFPSVSVSSSPSRNPGAMRDDFDGHIASETEAEEGLFSPTSPSKPGPSTPRSKRDSSRHQSSYQATVDENAMEVDTKSPYAQPLGEPLRSRRFRPVFLDHKQWFGRDPRVEREWELAEAHKQSMIGLYGHPFEKYRPSEHT